MARSHRTIAGGSAFALTLASPATTLTALGAEASRDTAVSISSCLGGWSQPIWTASSRVMLR